MAELEDNNAVIDLERLTSKVDIKDDEATTLDKHNEMLMTTEKLARQSTRPHSSQDDFYVLVLIDMYSHQFVPQLLRSYNDTSEDLPMEVKQRLHAAVAEHLPYTDSGPTPSNHRIELRAYTGSKVTDKCSERSLVSSLNQHSNEEEQGDLKVELEITKNFMKAVEDEYCTRIFFAAWGRPVYLSLLKNAPQKVVLVEGSVVGHGMQMLSLPCRLIRFPMVFTAAHKEDRLLKVYAMIGKHHPIGSLVISASFSDARCSHGTCGLTHSNRSVMTATQKTIQESPKINLRIPGFLPPYWQASPDQVPVNKYGQRLDYYIKLPEYSVRQAYHERYPNHIKPCKWHHLIKYCHVGAECSYDHSELKPEFVQILRNAVRKIPCKLGSKCRRPECIFGHICQNKKCAEEKVKTCPLRKFHRVDPSVTCWLTVDDTFEVRDEPNTDTEVEEGLDAPEESFWF